MKKALVLFAFGLSSLVSCSKSDETAKTDCSTTTRSFATEVNPIIQSSCATNATCHGSGSLNGPGPLLTYNHVFNARTSIKSAVGNGSMPKNGTLTEAQRSAIICWVDNGAPNN
jgi:hypothetical protein